MSGVSYENVKISVEFTPEDGEMKSGESLPELIGKTASHISDSNIHVTAGEKTKWNAKADKSDIPTTLPANGGNADTVNGHTVNADVPANAKFTDTDTKYSAGTGISISGTTISNSGVRSVASGSANGTISVNLSNIKYGNGNSRQCRFWVYRNSYSTGDNSTEMELSKELSGASKENYGSATATLSTAGNYVIKALLFSVTGSQSGVSFYDGSCDYTITFS